MDFIDLINLMNKLLYFQLSKIYLYIKIKNKICFFVLIK